MRIVAQLRYPDRIPDLTTVVNILFSVSQIHYIYLESFILNLNISIFLKYKIKQLKEIMCVYIKAEHRLIN